MARASSIAASGATTAAVEFSEQAVWAALKTCFDPEIPVNIVDLGLIYDLAIERVTDGHVVEVKNRPILPRTAAIATPERVPIQHSKPEFPRDWVSSHGTYSRVRPR